MGLARRGRGAMRRQMLFHRPRIATTRSPATPIGPSGCGGTAPSSLSLLGHNESIAPSSLLESRVMFEVRFQTYWADADPAGIVFFPHYFRLMEQAEEELFRAAGEDRQRLLVENRIWLPRVEAFAKFSKPIWYGEAIRVRLNPQFQGLKTVKYDFVFLNDRTSESLAAGYVTVVCVDTANFKSTPIPERIRRIIEGTIDKE